MPDERERCVLCEQLTSGGVAGAAGIIVSQPLDVIRIRLQTNVVLKSSAGASKRKPNMFTCFRDTLLTDGVRGLYKGVFSPVVTIGIMNAVLFASHDWIIRKLSGSTYHDRRYVQQPAWHEPFSGFFCGVVTSPINGPTDMVKCNAQVDITSKGTLSEEYQVLKDMCKRDGVFTKKGLCRGLFLTACRDGISFSIYFGVYEYYKRKFEEAGWGRHSVTLTAGSIAGGTSWGIPYPIDTLKSRWVVCNESNLWRYMLREYQSFGPRLFYQGWTATVLRAIPQHAVTFYVYESIHTLYQQYLY